MAHCLPDPGRFSTNITSQTPGDVAGAAQLARLRFDATSNAIPACFAKAGDPVSRLAAMESPVRYRYLNAERAVKRRSGSLRTVLPAIHGFPCDPSGPVLRVSRIAT